MFRYALLAGICCIAVTSNVSAQTSTGPRPKEVAAGLAANKTSVQQDAFWQSVKGKEVKWVIEVFEVVPGWFSGFYVRGTSVDTSTIAVSCELDGTPSMKTMAESINIGDTVFCAGKLDDPRMSLMVHTGVTIKNSTVTRAVRR
jgi:hypothetical protein